MTLIDINLRAYPLYVGISRAAIVLTIFSLFRIIIAFISNVVSVNEHDTVIFKAVICIELFLLFRKARHFVIVLLYREKQ